MLLFRFRSEVILLMRFGVIVDIVNFGIFAIHFYAMLHDRLLSLITCCVRKCSKYNELKLICCKKLHNNTLCGNKLNEVGGVY